ncbi:MBL fold metallo-hydrolase [Nakamurella leprariae]|uniref:MBL fold metallo-hydrolase n=1 Tax=Nakamurella leprariae TaxID=2803911 RepID=A0A938YFD2_9ACTN|nr:MBL fold metallo-hydrolase [Nakamurella leprariae]MBM9467392.1 MBL fold metallo-hydrolase [Nakamurella leprariae]
MSELIAGEWRRPDPRVSVLLAPNPGPMTLDGTNSHRLAAPGASTGIVIDPGPDDAGHLRRLAEAGRVDLVLITHRHADHTGGSAGFAALTGAPVRALDPAFCLDADPLRDGELIEVAGLSVQVVATPGHTADSVCFMLPAGPTAGPAVFTGDTILGRGTTVLAPPDGTLRDYLASLHRLRALGPARVFPAHGPDLPDLTAISQQYLDHREQRLGQIRAALVTLGTDAAGATVAAVADVVYADVDPSVRGAAESSVAAQLTYLRGDR